jgi:O-antigen ligase
VNNVKSIQIRESLIRGDWTYAMALITMILMPIHVQYVPPIMIAWICFWLIEKYFNKTKLLSSEKHIIILLVAFGSFFAILSVGLAYSQNLKNGTLLLFRRLSLLIFPLILFSPGEKIKVKIKNLLKVFVFGNTLFLISCFIYAFVRSIHIQDGIFTFNPFPDELKIINYFIGLEFSFPQHPSYISMYVILSIFVALEFGFMEVQRPVYRILWLSICIFLLVSLYFLSSRAGILIIIVLLPIYIIIKTRKIKYNGILILLFIMSTLVLLALFISNKKIQISIKEESGTAFIEKIKSDDRMSIWKSAIGVIKDNPILGVGIGDSCEELKKEFKALGFVKGYYEDLNAHNQYLEVLLASGIIGFFVFISIPGLMLYIAFREKNLLYLLFILMMLIFFMFESMLNRIAGVTFFSLFSFLLVHLKSDTILSLNRKSS